MKGCHFIPANGDAKQNKVYCHKNETRLPGGRRVERGTPPVQGSRTDIVEMQLAIKNGKDDVEMFEEFPIGWARYSRVLMAYRNDLFKPRNFMTQTIVYWGDTGYGKSRRAYHDAKLCYKRIGFLHIGQKNSRVWVDGCLGAEAVIMEDFEGEISFRYLLRLLDRYPSWRRWNIWI